MSAVISRIAGLVVVSAILVAAVAWELRGRHETTSGELKLSKHSQPCALRKRALFEVGSRTYNIPIDFVPIGHPKDSSISPYCSKNHLPPKKVQHLVLNAPKKGSRFFEMWPAGVKEIAIVGLPKALPTWPKPEQLSNGTKEFYDVSSRLPRSYLSKRPLIQGAAAWVSPSGHPRGVDIVSVTVQLNSGFIQFDVIGKGREPEGLLPAIGSVDKIITSLSSRTGEGE